MTDPVLIGLPTAVDTDRLLLRAPRAGDGAALLAAVSESLPELRQFLAWRSRRVAERCGFSLEGTLRNERRAPDGSLRNTCVYARLRPA